MAEISLLWEKQTRHSAKVVRMDRGSEFVNPDFHDFLFLKGSDMKRRHPTYLNKTAGKTDLIGLSTRKSILLFLQAQAPASMWCDAVPASLMLLNLQTVKAKNFTPCEAVGFLWSWL